MLSLDSFGYFLQQVCVPVELESDCAPVLDGGDLCLLNLINKACGASDFFHEFSRIPHYVEFFLVFIPKGFEHLFADGHIGHLEHFDHGCSHINNSGGYLDTLIGFVGIVSCLGVLGH